MFFKSFCDLEVNECEINVKEKVIISVLINEIECSGNRKY